MASTSRHDAASIHNNDLLSTTSSRTTDSEDDTPRTEATPAIVATLPTPSRINHGSTQDGGYFALKPTESHTSAGISSVQASPTPSIASTSSSSLKLREAVLDVTRRLSAHFEPTHRPGVQRDFSTESNDSSVTVRAAHGPRYPNQAFSALHQQQYPAPHLPPGARFRNLHPAQPVNFSSAIAQLHQTGLRHSPNTLSVTPGLFNPSPTESPDTPTSEGAYPSPYLHHLHTQIPKETHVADIDVDPISGRKIINGYEIIDELGRGTHGKVKLGRSLSTGNYVAIKIVERYSKKRRLGRLGNAEDKVKKEVAILKKARHPNIVALLEVIDDPTRKKVYIVLERVDLGEIQWRTDGAREIATIECRRYERECRGIFDDEAAEQEDQAMLDLARVRRVQAARARVKQLKKSRHERHIWSIELAGESDEDSEIDAWSRMSASTEDRGVANAAGRMISRTHTPAPPESEHDHDDFTTSHDRPGSPVRTNSESEDLVHRLEGSMYGGYDEPLESNEPDHEDTRTEQYHNDLHALSRNLSHDNLLSRAVQLLDVDLSRDLLQVPCMTISAARSAFRDTLLGLQYLHYQGIIHRDIKPPNLLQTKDRRTKISDFGVSYLGRPSDEEQAENLSESDARDFDEGKELAKTVGTPAFYAPELCYTDTTADHPPVGKAIDVWALGITLFCMLFGRVPFIDQEFIVMRRIAEEEIYIPNKRLKPIDPRPKSRPNSHGRSWTNPPGYRNPVALEYEDLDDMLLDLLHSLLTKDPRQRITLEEIRHHPWVLADIPDREAWLVETDPTRQGQGEKIEVSREDIEQSVVPITIMERIRSGIKKAVAVGLGRSSSAKSRTPSHSGSTTSIGSAGSGLEMRRSSLRGDESIFSALKASREGGDHPLAQSEVASPEHAPRHQPYTAHTTSLGTPRVERDPPTPTSAPRFIRDRQASTMSSTGSSRTVKQSDVAGDGTHDMSSPDSPLLSSSAEETTESLLSVSAGKLLRGVRERSAMGRTSEGRSRSASQASSEAEYTHSEPSIAVSTASASGMLNPPEALRQITPASSNPDSPTKSKNASSNTSPRKSLDHISTAHALPERIRSPISPTSAYNESAPADFQRADDENLRRHIAERLQRPTNRFSRNSSLRNSACPPSPDDEIYATNHGQEAASTDSVAASAVPSLQMSPASPLSSALPLITPNTSEDTFALGPHSSYSHDPDSRSEPFYAHYASKDDSDSDSGPSHPSLRVTLDDGYSPDTEHAAIDTDDDYSDYDSDEDDDGGLQMMRRRSTAQGAGRSMSISNATLARRRESVWSKKSSRSGSGGTMMKVRTRSQGDGEGERSRRREVEE